MICCHTSIGIEEEVGASEARHVGAIIVPNSVRIEQLASVIGVVALGLEPQWKPVFVIATLHKLGVSTVWRADIRDVLWFREYLWRFVTEYRVI